MKNIGRNFRRNITSVCVLAMVISACSSSNSPNLPIVPGPTPAPASALPQIASFTASSPSITNGQSVTLSWTITGATSLSLAPGVGAVTGSSITVRPTATTDYVLTATNAVGSTTATVRVEVTPFVADDQQIGDPNTSYLQIEVSPDQRFMTWNEEGAGPGGAGIVWLCALDPVAGVLKPSDGRGVRIADIAGIGSAQWGQDATGFFSLMTDTAGRLIIARPSLTSNGNASASITTLPTPANATRVNPYASRVAVGTGYILYHQDDPSLADRPQLWWTSLADPTREVQITQGPTARIGVAGLPPFLVNVQRWFYDVATLGNGIPVSTYGNTAPNASGVQQLVLDQIDFTSQPPDNTRVAGSAPQFYDPFPFLYQGQRYILTGIAAGPVGAVYQRDANGQYTVEVNRIETTGSGLTTPNNFASAEPFLRNGKLYSAYQLNEPGAPGTSNGEIWLTSVLDNSLRRRISAPTAARRADPEFFFGTTKTWVLYYSRTSNTGRWQIRRADTGL